MRDELVETRATGAAAVSDIRAAERKALAEGERVPLRPVGRVVIVSATNDAVGVEGPIARAVVEDHAAQPLDAVARNAGKGFEVRAFANLHRNAVVDGVHHAADRLAPVAQAWPALAALSTSSAASGSTGTRVIVADIGDVVTAEAVLGHAHARGTQTADHRPRRAGGEARRGHARHVLQRIAKADAT